MLGDEGEGGDIKMSDKKCKEAAPGAVALAQKGILAAVAVCQTPGDQYHGLVTRGGDLLPRVMPLTPGVTSLNTLIITKPSDFISGSKLLYDF